MEKLFGVVILNKIVCAECGKSFAEEDMDLVDRRWVCRECEKMLSKCRREEN